MSSIAYFSFFVYNIDIKTPKICTGALKYMKIPNALRQKSAAVGRPDPYMRRPIRVLLLILALFTTSCGQRAAETSSGPGTVSAPLAAVRINREAAGIAGITPRTADGTDASAAGVFCTIADNGADSTETSLTAPESPDDNMPANASYHAPLPGDPDFRVHGIYVTAPVAGIDRIHDLIALADETDINAFVIDIKDDLGKITYPMDTPTVQEIGSAVTYISDMEGLIAECKAHGIYLIARIVTFKDPYLAKAIPEYALCEADGTMFLDNSGLAWVNPYEQGVWDYLMEIATEAARIGFDEIQFDYIRFSTDKGMDRVVFGPNAGDLTKTDIINAFTDYAYETLAPYSVAVSADVYGTIIDNAIDRSIVGQDYAVMASKIDVICPMVYPSHYGAGVYRIDVPDAEPYRTVTSALNASRTVLDQYGHDTIYAVSENGMPSICRVRPWLQAFTATWVRGHIEYDREQIQEQIQAVLDAGYDEWLFWNATVKYDAGWF